ncbi:MAG: hypothetical protein IPG45_26230 [Deltaproteobacteria bacterium]|jgi:hypothetical protein|nr:hypothetical protein [Deltaproteobacteria bacterium]
MFLRTASLLALLLFAPRPAQAAAWEPITQEDGITVWQRAVPGTSLVEFRGKGRVGAHVKKILAVLHDTHRKTEWMQNCVESTRLKKLGPGQSIMYNRTGSTVPLVADRDVVLESAVTIWREKGQVKVEVWNVDDPAKPPVDGVVRMPRLQATWTLVALDQGNTEITYQVQADPGGALPAWVVNLVAKKIPLHTIQNLRKQVVKSGYDQDLAYVDGAFPWDGFLFSEEGPALQAGPDPSQIPASTRDM